MIENGITYGKNFISRLTFDKAAVGLATLIVSVLVCILLISTNGNIGASAGIVCVISAVLVIIYRVEWGFYLFFFMALIFDQFGVPNFDTTFTTTTDYFKNIKENANLPSIAAGVMNPVELQFVLMLLAWFIAISVRKQNKIQHINEWGVGLIFFTALISFFIYGMKTGGEFLPALWEIRALFYFGFMFYFVPQVIQTKKQIEILMWVFIAGVTFKAFQGSFRFASLGLSFGGFETLTNHEDPVFITILFILLISLAVLKVNKNQRNVLLALFIVLVLGFLAGQRRAAYAGLFVSILVFITILQGADKLKIFKVLMPVLFIVIIYAGAFWESESRIASPLKLIRSGIDPDAAGERHLSNLYREFERYNLAYTVKTTNPVFGIGFGNKYKNQIPLADLKFPLRDYIPHNEILWIIVKTGAVGFFIFWFFFNALIFRTSYLYSKLQDPYLKAICILIIIAILNQMTVSYFDLQLTYYRNMIVLGTLCGLIPTLNNYTKVPDDKTEIVEEIDSEIIDKDDQ